MRDTSKFQIKAEQNIGPVNPDTKFPATAARSKALARARARCYSELVGETVYLRLGKPTGRSQNHSNGDTLAGQSVLKAEVRLDAHGYFFAILDQLTIPSILFMGDRPVFVIRCAKEIGRGPDNETLIKGGQIAFSVGLMATFVFRHLVEM